MTEERTYAEFDEIKGKTLTDVTYSSDFIKFEFSDGTKYEMYHDQDCCESVYIDSIDGNIFDLKGETILEAYESVNPKDAPVIEDDYIDSYTWTFYRIRTVKDTIVIRWYGTSNGYYSESVDFYRVA